MTHMGKVGRHHVLVLNTQTDESKVIDRLNEEVFMTFNSSGTGMDKHGKTLCYIRLDCHNNWVVKNELGIQTQPVSFDKKEGIFDVEAEFALKWLEQNGITTT